MSQISAHFDLVKKRYDGEISRIKRELMAKAQKAEMEVLRNKTDAIQTCVDTAARKEDLERFEEDLQKMENFRDAMKGLDEKRLKLIADIEQVDIYLQIIDEAKKGEFSCDFLQYQFHFLFEKRTVLAQVE